LNLVSIISRIKTISPVAHYPYMKSQFSAQFKKSSQRIIACS